VRAINGRPNAFSACPLSAIFWRKVFRCLVLPAANSKSGVFNRADSGRFAADTECPIKILGEFDARVRRHMRDVGFDSAPKILAEKNSIRLEIKSLTSRIEFLSAHSGGNAMPTLIMLTRLNPDAVRSPRGLEQSERDAMKRVREQCPDVEWRNSNAVLGACDYLSSRPTTSRLRPVFSFCFGHSAMPRLKSGRDGVGPFKEIVRMSTGPG